MTRMNNILQCKSQQINKYNSFKLRWTYRLTVSSLLYMVIMTRMGHHVLLSACQILLCHWFNLFGLVAKFCCAGARARPPSRDHVPRVLLAYTQRMRWRSGSRGGKKKKTDLRRSRGVIYTRSPSHSWPRRAAACPQIPLLC
jgi:hypothetical protein